MVLLLKLCMWSCWYVSSVHMTLDVVKVFFRSVNFCTILHWETTCDGQPTCTYEVKYKVYGDGWQQKTDCDRTKNFCNMTAEMLMKENVDEKIFAKVIVRAKNAKSSWKISKEFKPIEDTIISPPEVAVTPLSDTILVHIIAPLLLYHIKYAGTNYEKKMTFIIKVSALSQVITTEYTEKTIWTMADLPPGNYCISVNMKYGEVASSSSRNECVVLKDVIAEEVRVGSILAVFASVVVGSILTIYLILYRNVFYPKPPLPSNLILHNKKSKPSDYKADGTFMAPSIFEGMEFSKYILASDEKEQSQNKRYVSTEIRRKDYANCRKKDFDQNVLLDKTVELRNSTYGTKPFPVEHPNVWLKSQARYTEIERSPHNLPFF
ncbi:uncharacterized protein LOC122936200 [Bufo gargarizans]|uniref:uncharacterized protein LOC122936200 n=1 Tax=Bufo gargarizans TaxID=30331 RepID=UPI001CF219D9|nr:uncharacterized protein LOC122936200 [Bufo gargarizans]